MGSIIQALQDMRDLVERTKRAPLRPLVYTYPPSLVKAAAEIFKSQNVYINGTDGSQYFRGELIKAPTGTHIVVTRLNERIAAMDLPNNLKKIQPVEYEAHLLGQWHTEEKG